MSQEKYFLYMLKCVDTTLYTGITNDIEKRLKMHNGEIPGGAKYTSGRRPVELLYFEDCEDRSQATKKEREIKKLSREKKLEYIQKNKSL